MSEEGVLARFSLRGRGALVTGAARGSVGAMAIALAEAGADIVAIDVEPLDAVSHAVTDRGARCAAREQDLRGLTPDAAADLMAWSRSELGDVSVLVNNDGPDHAGAGGGDVRGGLGTRHVIGLNLTAPFFLAQAFASPLLAGRRAGKHRQRRVDELVPGRHGGAGLHGVQARPPRSHARAGERVDRARDPGSTASHPDGCRPT